MHALINAQDRETDSVIMLTCSCSGKCALPMSLAVDIFRLYAFAVYICTPNSWLDAVAAKKFCVAKDGQSSSDRFGTFRFDKKKILTVFVAWITFECLRGKSKQNQTRKPPANRSFGFNSIRSGTHYYSMSGIQIYHSINQRTHNFATEDLTQFLQCSNSRIETLTTAYMHAGLALFAFE